MNGTDSRRDGLVIKDGVLISYKGSDSTVEIPEGVTCIKQKAFYDNRNIVTVVLPESLIEIEEYGFANCTKLKSINLNAVKEIGAKAFDDCRELEHIELDNISVIREGTFYNCRNLKEVRFGNVELIEDNAFYGYYIKSLTLPASLKAIGVNVFGNYPCRTDSYLIEIPKTVGKVKCTSSRHSGDSYGGVRGYRSITIYDNLKGRITIPERNKNSIIFVKKAKGDDLKYIIPLFCDDTYMMLDPLKQAFNEDNFFDFNVLDNYFKSIKDPEVKASIAVTRLLDPFELSEEAKKNYESYISRNATEIIKQLIDDDENSNTVFVIKAIAPYINQDIYQIVERFGLVKKTNVDELIEHAQKHNKSEWIDFLNSRGNKKTDPIKETPDVKQLSYEAGDIIQFGNNDWGGGNVPLEWIVADSTKDRYLLVSRYLVKQMPFYSHNYEKKILAQLTNSDIVSMLRYGGLCELSELYELVYWSNSDVRAWLNGEFLANSFNANERNRISLRKLKNAGDTDTEDYVFIPSKTEYDKYIDNSPVKAKLMFIYGEDRYIGASEMVRETEQIKSTFNNTPVFKQKVFLKIRENGYTVFLKGTGDIHNPYYIRPMMWISKK